MGVGTMTVPEHGATRIIGGASFPARVGTLTVTWALAVAEVSENGISVDVRFRLLKKVTIRFLDLDSKGLETAFWRAPWDRLESIDFGRRSVVLRQRSLPSCRFVTWRRHRLLPIVDEVEARAIPVRHVRSTLGWFFSR